MVCRIEDVDDLFKAFNSGKAADFTAEDLAEQVCTWLAWLCLTIDCIPPLGRVTRHRVFLCQIGVCTTWMLPSWCCYSPQQAARLQSEPQEDSCHCHIACLQVETGVGSFKRSSKFLQQPIFNLYQVREALPISSLHDAREQMYAAAAVPK